MRTHQHCLGPATGARLVESGERVYEAHRARVDGAYQRMRALSDGPHASADARQAADELTAALRVASTTAAQLLRQLRPPATPPHGRWRHRHAGRLATPPVAWWSNELVRLSEIAVWLRRTTLDGLGVHLPATVRVGNYAANGPHIAGLDFGACDLADLHQPRIGVDLRAIVDGLDQDLPASRAA